MGIRFSTGRYPRKTRVKHSTGTEWADLEKLKQKKYFTVKYSTGKDASIRHMTGLEFDFIRHEQEMAKNGILEVVNTLGGSANPKKIGEMLEMSADYAEEFCRDLVSEKKLVRNGNEFSLAPSLKAAETITPEAG